MTQIPFLQQIVQDIDLNEQDLRSLKDHCYVFPTRRAAVYFKKYLTGRFEGRHFWAPQICSIVEFIELLTDRVILNPVTLVFELFDIYKNYEPEADFDSFYPWGQIILKDFDEIDKYLVDAPKLFSIIKDYKTLEEEFALPLEQFEFLKQFWNLPKTNETEANKESKVKQEFIRIWEILGKVYADFEQALTQNHAAYEGMAQKLVLQQLKNGALTPPFTKIVWAGFNALTAAEKGIAEHLCNLGNTTIYWDTDAYYMNDEKQEAGKFMRRYFTQWQNHLGHNWKCQTNLLKSGVNIHSIGVPLRVGQAKYAGQLLQNLLNNRQISLPETAVVLGDETMLFPMLYALPPNTESVNITMGYPLHNSPLYRLLETIVQMQKTRQDPKNNPNDAKTPENNLPDDEKLTKQQKIYPPNATTLFYSKFVLQLLQNPFIKQFDPEKTEKYIDYIAQHNLVYIYNFIIAGQITQPVYTDKKTIQHNPKDGTEERTPSIYKTLFSKTDNFLQLADLFNTLLTTLFNQAKAKAGENAATNLNSKPDEVTGEGNTCPPDFMEMEFIYQLLRQLRILLETLRKYRQQITIDTFWKIFREVIQTVALPFTGEPLRGLQIMGFLETRTLDFDNLFVLGLNEGIIPAAKPHLTFIPFNLRKGFGMPTFLDQDAIFAYHFYHLLQRSKNVYLLYNTEPGNVGSNEKSRFLLQLEQELNSLPATAVQLQKYLISTQLSQPIHRQPVTINKTPAVMEKLNRYLLHLQNDTQDKLSPTALSAYINCPVQFYFKYVAQLYEIQNVNEEINNLIFGNILHKTIELLYQPFKNKQITQSDIDELLKNSRHIDRTLNQAFTEKKFEHHKEGKNLLLKRVLKRLVIKILQNDKKDAPFTIIGLETAQFSTALDIGNGKQVVISGSIDRVDEVNFNHEPTYRILDYKTGNVTIKKDKNSDPEADITQYLADYFSDPELKAGFQAYLYCYLFWVQKNKNARIQAGIYELKKLSQGINYLRRGQLIDAAFLQTFEENLKNLLTTLFNPDVPFVQTEHSERYTYSPYQGLVQL